MNAQKLLEEIKAIASNISNNTDDHEPKLKPT
jgi:hypothetical protein